MPRCVPYLLTYLLFYLPAYVLSAACGAGMNCPTGEAAAALDGGVHDSIVLAGCEAVSVIGQPG